MKVYVPLNEKGIEELESCQENETENLKIYVFSPEDYFYLDNQKYFDYLNVECGCLIDLYEEERISNDKLKIALDITEILIHQSTEAKFVELANKFVNIFKSAIRAKTYIIIYCYGELI